MSVSVDRFMHRAWPACWAVVAGLCLSACGGGGGGDSAAIQARAQAISFGNVSPVTVVASGGIASGSTQVLATVSSGLPLVYSSATPDVCSVDAQTGRVTVRSAITDRLLQGCRIAADQFGNETFAPVRQVQVIGIQVDPIQSIAFESAPSLSLFSTVTVSAMASSGLTVSYGSATPSVCTVDASTGLVSSLTAGTCTLTARQAGNAIFQAAPDASLSLPVSVPSGLSVPGAPTGVSATMGTAVQTVKVSIGATDSGGSPITAYVVTSIPAGLSATGTASPIVVACGGSCNGYAFSVAAVSAVGQGASSAPVDVLTTYQVVETFYEPATQPNDSIFKGTFTLNATTGAVSNLAGTLTQSMTGGSTSLSGGPSSGGTHYGDVPMTLVSLSHQRSVQAVNLGGVNGLLVTTFARPTTDTFYKSGVGGLPVNDGWTPAVGVDVGGIYFGFPSAPNPSAGGVGNAYAMVFINPQDPLAPLNQAQLDKLAYADCTAGGMMGAACMTGTSVAGYGSAGTMGGYPVSQTIVRAP
jgi:hypothetical protein